jgi:signal transduction histidine kinase
MAELAHMNRRDAAGEMSASIAHEIKQPLAAIILSGDAGMRWLAKKTPNIEEAVDSFQRIVSEGHRASHVIETVRAMFKKDTAQRTPADINELIREVLTLMHIELEKGQVEVKCVLTSELPQVLIDRIQLQQGILNLARNAVEAMNPVTGRPSTLRVRSEATDSEVIISIEDSGPGIDPENMERIFEPFFTTKPKGMGMGLSICRSIVESHGGRLSAAPGKLYGSVFELVLPLSH